MDLSKARFTELFALAFLVGGAFFLALFLAGVAVAFLNPGLFYSGAAQHVAARSPLEALGVVAMMSLFAVVFNLTVASGGACAFIAFRWIGRYLPKTAARRAS